MCNKSSSVIVLYESKIFHRGAAASSSHKGLEVSKPYHTHTSYSALVRREDKLCFLFHSFIPSKMSSQSPSARQEQPRYFCYSCNAEVPIYMAPDPTCQRCNEQFVQEVSCLPLSTFYCTESSFWLD